MNDKSLAELKAYLDGRFDVQNRELRTHMDARFDAQRTYIDGRFEGTEKHISDRFDMQRNYLEARFDIVEREIRELRADVTDMHGKFSALQSAVDHYVLRAEVLADEQLVIKHQMDRFERQLKTISEKVGVELDYAV
jgi:predicted  nucleic acid-binding Zn-ribbon protein